MKKISLQWRITLMTAILLCVTCVVMNCLIIYSGKHYMDVIGSGISPYSDNAASSEQITGKSDESNGKGESGAGADSQVESFNPENSDLNHELTIIVDSAQESFGLTGWCITAFMTFLGGVLAYFVTGHALKPLRTFTSQIEMVQPNNLSDMKISEEVLPEFQPFSKSFNGMIQRLDEGFSAQRQFTGNAAHELRTPLALMQAQMELFAQEHPVLRPETRDFLKLLQEQTERMSQMTKTLLEMSELRSVPCEDEIELAPMIEEIYTDLAPVAEEKGVLLKCEGNARMIGSDTLIYRMLFNLTENAIRYNRSDGAVTISICKDEKFIQIRVSDTGFGIPEQYRESIFHPFFRVDKSRSREHGGVGLGLSLVWEIAALHGGAVRVEESSEAGTVVLVTLRR